MLWTIFLVLFLFLVYKSTRKPQGFPPGPPRLPIIGSLPYILDKPKNSKENLTLFYGVTKLLKKYGKLCGFYVGKDPVIVVADYQDLKALMKLDELTYRPDFYPMNEYRYGNYYLKGTRDEGAVIGVSMTNGQTWIEQRRFLMKHLKELGFGKSWMDDVVVGHLKLLLKELDKLCGKPADIKYRLSVTAINSIWTVLFGEVMDFNDPEILKGVGTFFEFFENTSFKPLLASIVPYQPILKLRFMEKLSGLDKMRNAFETVTDELILPQVKKHLDNFDPDNLKDLTDIMIQRIKEDIDPESSFYGEKGIAFMVNDFMEIFGGGVETTASTLLWVVFMMLHHPKVLAKAQREIDSMVGDQEMMHFADKAKLPYVSAIIHETHRIASLGYFSIPHTVNRDLKYKNYVLPKGSLIMQALFSIMHDPENFPDPEKFDPDRFIDQDGQFVSNPKVIPFSIGKRDCLGKNMAEQQLFLFTVSLFRRYNFSPPPLQDLPPFGQDFTCPSGVVRYCPKFQVLITKRWINGVILNCLKVNSLYMNSILTFL